MKCVICKGGEIEVKSVDEQISVGDDILLFRLEVAVCNQCGERYYDRRTMQRIEEIRAQGKKSILAAEEVGKILRAKTMEHNASPGL